MENKKLDDNTIVLEAARCLLCHDAPCSELCPAKTDPAKFIRSVRFDNYFGAAETIRENNPLGGICARICPVEKYCQKGCIRKGMDKPIDIAGIQEYLTDFENRQKMQIYQKEKSNGKKVAIVGGGVSGLTAANRLLLLGYDVAIYEKEEKLGGVLRYGIPSFRLPKEIVDQEINYTLSLNPRVYTNKELDKDFTISQLKKENDAVILATGFSYGNELAMFKDSKTISALSYLKNVQLGKDEKYHQAIIIGGGDVAMDVAATLKSKGCEQIYVVARETFDIFPASQKELAEIRSLNIPVFAGFTPHNVDKNTVEFIDKENNILKLSSDIIIQAVGQSDRGLSANYKEDQDIFLTGDIAEGEKTAVYAIRLGKEVAQLVHQKLSKEDK